MSRRSDLPDRLTEVPFARQTALAAGVARGRLTARDLESPFHAVRRAVGAPEDIYWQCRSYVQRMRAGDAFSHVTAALLLGAPLPRYVATSKLHVAAPFGTRAPTGRGIVGHQPWALSTPPLDLVRQDHLHGELFTLPVVPALTVFAQLAPLLDRGDLVAVGDYLVGGSEPVLRPEEMASLRELSGGWRGRTSALAAVDSIRLGSRSRPESLLRLQLEWAGLPAPQLNLTAHDQRGERIGEPDFSWPEFRVLAEYDSEQFHGERRRRTDGLRMDAYTDGGWSGLVAYSANVFDDPNPFIARLARRLRDRGWRSTIDLSHVQGARR